MADRQLAQHPLGDAGEVAPAGEVGDERGVLAAHRRPVGAVVAGVVEVVAVDAPGLVEHLRPLGGRVHLDLDPAEIELELGQVELVALVRDVDEVPVVLDAHERALRVGREREVARLLEQRLLLPLLEVVAVHRRVRVGVGGGRPAIEQLVRRSRLQVGVDAGLHRQGEDPLREALGVELDLDRLLLLLLLRFLRLTGRRLRGLALLRLCRLRPGARLRLVLLLLLPALLLVALLQQRRGHALREHRQIDLLDRSHVGVRLREPVLDGSGVRRDQEVEVLAGGVEGRARGVGEAVAHRVRLAVRDRVERQAVEVGRGVPGVREVARVGRPGVVEHGDGAVERVARDLRLLPARHVEDEDASASCR